MTDNGNKIVNTDNQSLIAFLLSMESKPLGVLSFNLGGLAWIGLNLSIGSNFLPCYRPGAYLYTLSPSLLFIPVLIFAFALACLAIKRGSLLPAAITLTFGWSLIMSVIRALAP